MTGGDLHDRDVVVGGGVEHVERAQNVDLGGGVFVADRLRRAEDAGEVDDGVAALEPVVEGGRPQDRLGVVESDGLVAAGGELGRDPGADEPVGAGDEHSHGTSSTSTRRYRVVNSSAIRRP